MRPSAHTTAPLTITGLVIALLVSLLPVSAAAGQEADPPGPAGDPPSTAPPSTAEVPAQTTAAWSPGDLDVDWAAFAAEHRAEYEGSSFASATAQDDAARQAATEAIQAEYLAATGGDGSGYADLGTSRSGALAQQYYDECDDGTNLPDNGVQASRELLYRGGADGTGGVSYNPVGVDPTAPFPLLDLRSVFVLQSTDEAGRFDQTGFLVYTCKQWAFEDLGPGGITFGLYPTYEDSDTRYPTVLGDPETGPDFIVSIFPEPNIPQRRLQIMAIRTPSRDRDTWTVTFIGPANRLDGYEIDGVVPTSAIGDFSADDGFAWTVETTDRQTEPSAGRDWFPERNWQLRVGEGEDAVVGTHIPQFPVPESCGLQRESTEAFTLTPQQVQPDDDGYPVQWYHPTIRSPQAWSTIRDSSTGGRSRPVTVAVIDTGIDATRFDFVDGGPRITAGLDAVYGLELEGGDNGGALGPIIGPRSVRYDTFETPRNSDRDPHGTGVASLIGARGGNRFGIAGVDWGVRLMPIRVNDVNGCITSDVVAEGIKWAIDHGADVIHISLAASEVLTVPGGDPDTPECRDGIDNDRDGTADFQPPAGAQPDLGCESADDGSEGVDVSDGGDGGLDPTPACSDGRDNDGDGAVDTDDADCSSPDDDFEGNDGESPPLDPLREVVDYAVEKSVPVVAASGNFGGSGDPVILPAAYPGVIAVGATTRAGQYASYSGTGRWIHVAAPGGDNSGTLAGDLAVLWELDRIRSVAGTSFSAPLVTGAISLYMGLNPHIARGFTPAASPQPPTQNYDDSGGYQRTVDDVRIAVQSFARDVAPAGHDIFTGWGVLNVDRMLDVEAIGGPLIDPARVQLTRTNADAVVDAAEDIALSRPTTIPPYAVVTRSDVAVDALAGAPLLAEGPLLVSAPDGLAPSTLSTLRELMPDGGPVYLLGGEAALGPEVAQQLESAGYAVTRLAGASRFETAIAVAEEVRRRWPDQADGTVAVARADGGDNPTAQWADALTGGAWAAATRTPILITPTDSVHPDVAAALERWGTTQTVAFGGEQALSASVLASLPGARRVAGDDRAATAVAVAQQLWEDPDLGVDGGVDGYMVVNGYYARGWVHGLAAAGWAADESRALVYTDADSLPPATADLLRATCPGEDGVHLVGGASLITGTAESLVAEATSCS